MTDPDLLVESVTRRRRSGTRRRAWDSLPSDLLEQVLPLLSFPEVFRLCCVCKRWNALIRCVQLPWGPFHTAGVGWKGNGIEWKRNSSRNLPWFAYDLSATTVRKTTMPRLEFPACAREAHWNLIASGGGLLCFDALGPRRRMLVCNPMTKAWRKLPDVSCKYSTRWATVTHMAVDECGSSYKILVADDAAVDLYDSVANKWSAVERFSPEMVFRSGAYYNGEMYLLGRMEGSDPYMVMILGLATQRWREDTIPMPATPLKVPFIVESSGVMFIVGRSLEVPMASILLFRRDPDGRWTRVSEYANHEFLKETSATYGCGAHGGRIFVMTRHANMGAFPNDMWVVVYNFATGVWEDPVKEDFFHMKHIYETKFAFQPNFIAVP